MSTAFHMALFGTIIAVVDLATHRIYRAVLFLAWMTLIPLITWSMLFHSVATALVLVPIYCSSQKWIGRGDLLLTPLAFTYFLALRSNQFQLFLIFLWLTLISIFSIRVGKSTITRRIPASPSIFLTAIIANAIR